MKTQFNTVIAGAFLALLSWSLTTLMLFVLAVPFQWLWNQAIAPLGPGPLGYWRALGVLLLWYVLEIARAGVKFSAKFD